MYDARKHRLEDMFIDSYGDKRVDSCLKKVVEIYTSVVVGKDIHPPPSRFLLNKQGGTFMRLVSSTERDPEYITDPSCTKVGELEDQGGKYSAGLLCLWQH